MYDSRPQKSKHLWHHFSLRSTLLFTAAVAGLLGIFHLGFQLGIAWVLLLLFIGTQRICLIGSARLPRGQLPGRLATALWVLLTWSIIVPWGCWLSEMRPWGEMPQDLFLGMAYKCLYKLNCLFALSAPLVFAAIGGLSRGSLRFFIVLIVTQVLLAMVVVSIAAWIASMYAWPSGYY
jgi:hypothetical protein